MPHCPSCDQELETVPQRQGVFFRCPSCDGRAVSIPQLRRVAGDHFAVRLLRLLKTKQGRSKSSCPFCGQRFTLFQLQEPQMDLQGCRPCSMVWFEAHHYQLVPEWTVASNTGISMQDV